MQPSITDAEPGACTNGEITTDAAVETQFETAVLRLKALPGWDAPFADLEDTAVRKITAILRENWRREKDWDA